MSNNINLDNCIKKKSKNIEKNTKNKNNKKKSISTKPKKIIKNKKKNQNKNKIKPSTINEYKIINFRNPTEIKALPKKPMTLKKYSDKKSGEHIAETLQLMGRRGVIPGNKRMLRTWENRQGLADDFRVAIFKTDIKILKKQLEDNSIVAFFFYVTLGLNSGRSPPRHHIQTQKVIEEIEKFRKEKPEIYEREKNKLRGNDI